MVRQWEEKRKARGAGNRNSMVASLRGKGLQESSFRVGNNAAPLKLNRTVILLQTRLAFRVGNNAAPLKRSGD